MVIRSGVKQSPPTKCLVHGTATDLGECDGHLAQRMYSLRPGRLELMTPFSG